MDKDWQAQKETRQELVTPEPASRLAASLDVDTGFLNIGTSLPPAWHWMYFTPLTPQSELADDGHPIKGGFLPPTSLPRRMFASVKTEYKVPLKVGLETTREGIVNNVKDKEGKSGKLTFVTVNYQYHQEGKLCVEEEQQIVYRESLSQIELPQRKEFGVLPGDAQQRIITPDSRLLFRFSALTFNTHRIHYDRDYAKSEEGYPALIVHAPLTTILLLQFIQETYHKPVRSTEFHARTPMFDDMPVRLVINKKENIVDTRAERCDGQIGVEGKVELE